MHTDSALALADPERLARVHALQDAAPPPDAPLDRLTQLAARVLGAPVALITVLDAHEQVLIGCSGLGEPWASLRRTPLSHSFCQHVVAADAPLVVADARTHPLVYNSLAIDDLGVIAYAGVPLHGADAVVLGALCVIDHVPRTWTEHELTTLGELAAAVEAELALRILAADHVAEAAHQAAQRRCLEALATDQPLDRVLTILAEGIEQQLRGGMCVVMLRDASTNTLTPIAAPSLPPAYVAAIAQVPIGPLAGACGTAAYYNAPVIANDVAIDARWEPWRPLTLSYGLRACWAHPIRNAQGAVLGTFACWYRQPHTPAPDERKVVAEAANLAAITITRARDVAALRASELRYRLLATHMDDVVTLHDSEGRYTYASPSHTKATGVAPESLLGCDGYHFIHPDDRARVGQSHAANQRGETTLTAWRFLRPDGALAWLETRTQPLAATADHPAQLLCVSRDVTARVATDASLAASVANLAALFANTADGIWSVDQDYRLVTANDPFYQYFLAMFGALPALGSSMEDLLPPDVAQRWRGWYDRALRGEQFSAEYAVRLDAATHWFDVAFNPIRTGSTISGVSVFSHAITERKQAEAQRLAHERAWQATQQLESLGVLAGGIAHDFGNLLMALRGHAELASIEHNVPAPVAEHLDRILRVTDHATELVQQILTYAGQQRPTRQRLDLRALLDEMARLLRAAIPRHIALDMQLAADIPPLAADATQLRQVILNLLVNAAEAIGDEPGRITVTLAAQRLPSSIHLRQHRPRGVAVEMAVTDTGRGMDAATLARVVEPFFTTKATGRGLGLAVVHGIVRGHRGVMHVQSALGQGTTFRVLLPCTPERYRARQLAVRQRPRMALVRTGRSA
ncbi:MAG: PAS domain S-box protein [Chloroflexales bacterium]|nr:PAS domain S-box protein [Chloroflexales bacterium]